MGKLALWSGIAGAAKGGQQALLLNVEEKRRKLDQARDERLRMLRMQHEKDLEAQRQTGRETLQSGQFDQERVLADVGQEDALERIDAQGAVQTNIADADRASREKGPKRELDARMSYNREVAQEFGFVPGQPSQAATDNFKRYKVSFGTKQIADGGGVREVQVANIGALGTSLERHDNLLVPDGTSEEARMQAAETLDSMVRDPRDPTKGISRREAMVIQVEKLPPERRIEGITESIKKYGVVPEELWHLVFAGG